MAASSVFLILLVGVTMSTCESPGPVHGPTTPRPTHCEYDGKTYQIGERFKPTPCMFCRCESHGQVLCAVADCAPPSCWDSVKDPDICCPRCPNGPNCLVSGESGDTIIPAGQKVTLEDGTECHCDDGLYTWGPPPALCILPPPFIDYQLEREPEE